MWSRRGHDIVYDSFDSSIANANFAQLPRHKIQNEVYVSLTALETIGVSHRISFATENWLDECAWRPGCTSSWTHY